MSPVELTGGGRGGGGGGRGTKSNDGEKALPSINHSNLSELISSERFHYDMERENWISFTCAKYSVVNTNS